MNPSPNNKVIIYRTCDRPKYMAITFPHLVTWTDPNTKIVVVENSEDRLSMQENIETFQQVAVAFPSRQMHLEVVGQRLNCNGAMDKGLQTAVQVFGEPDIVYIIDDDSKVPQSVLRDDIAYTWDQALETMLDGGHWTIVGHHHQDMIDDVIKLPIVGEGPTSGRESAFVSPACSAFRYELFKENPWDRKNLNIFSFNKWQRIYGTCAYSHYFDMINDHIDAITHPLSLRSQEYDDYSNEIWW